MKRRIMTIAITLVLLNSVPAMLAQSSGPQRFGASRESSGRFGARAGGGQFGIVAALPMEPLSQDEIDALKMMREEEKLARDVYLALHEVWDLPIFLNIASSEQRHFDAVGTLLEKYELDDPVANQVGAFVPGSEMERLYDELRAKGEASQDGALLVGATIEDLDIYDLRRWMEKVDNRDIQIVFQHLLNGSMNHLRAFTRLLQPQGYVAQYLSQDEVNEIIETARDRGRYRGSCGSCCADTGSCPGNCRRRAGSND